MESAQVLNMLYADMDSAARFHAFVYCWAVARSFNFPMQLSCRHRADLWLASSRFRICTPPSTMWSDMFLKPPVTVCWSNSSRGAEMQLTVISLEDSHVALFSQVSETLVLVAHFLHKGWRRLVWVHNLIVHCYCPEFGTDVKCLLLTLLWDESVCVAWFLFFFLMWKLNWNYFCLKMKITGIILNQTG